MDSPKCTFLKSKNKNPLFVMSSGEKCDIEGRLSSLIMIRVPEISSGLHMRQWVIDVLGYDRFGDREELTFYS